MEDVDEQQLKATLTFRVRCYDGLDQSDLVARIVETVGTFMIDTSNWRFQDLDVDDREAIVEIFAEVQ